MKPIDPVRHRRERIVAAAIVAGAILATAAIAIFNTRDAEEVQKQLTYIPKSIRITPELELLRQYLRIDTTNPPGNELQGARWLADVLAKKGVASEVIETAPGRAALYARIRGHKSGSGLLLLSHIDVVGASPVGWKKPPFAAEIWLDQLYGRGTLDMKGTAICELAAFLDVAKSGRTPAHDIVLLAVPDEEAGGSLGMQWLLQHRPDVIDGIRYAINEGGITEMKQERVTYFGIELGTKLTVTLLARASTRAALQRTRIALEPYFISRDAHRVLPEVRRWMRDLAPQRINFRAELADVDTAIAKGRFWELPLGYREMTQDNVWADGVHPAGDEWEMRIQLLNLMDADPEQRIAWLRAKIAPYGARVHEVVRKFGPVPVSSDSSPFFELLTREAKAGYETAVGTELLNRWANDSKYLRIRGIDVYGVSPFPVDFFQSDTIHSVDERVNVGYFEQGVAFLRRVVAAYAFER